MILCSIYALRRKKDVGIYHIRGVPESGQHPRVKPEKYKRVWLQVSYDLCVLSKFLSEKWKIKCSLFVLWNCYFFWSWLDKKVKMKYDLKCEHILFELIEFHFIRKKRDENHINTLFFICQINGGSDVFETKHKKRILWIMRCKEIRFVSLVKPECRGFKAERMKTIASGEDARRLSSRQDAGAANAARNSFRRHIV